MLDRPIHQSFILLSIGTIWYITQRNIYCIHYHCCSLTTIPLGTCNKLACGTGSQKSEPENYAECRKNPRPDGDLVHRQLAV